MPRPRPADWLGPRLNPGAAGWAHRSQASCPQGSTPTFASFTPLVPRPRLSSSPGKRSLIGAGGTFHTLAQFERMSIPVRPNPGPPPFDQAPFQGHLVAAICDILVRQLAGLTETPSACYFAIWDGGASCSVAGPVPASGVVPPAGGLLGLVVGGVAGRGAGR